MWCSLFVRKVSKGVIRKDMPVSSSVGASLCMRRLRKGCCVLTTLGGAGPGRSWNRLRDSLI